MPVSFGALEARQARVDVDVNKTCLRTANLNHLLVNGSYL